MNSLEVVCVGAHMRGMALNHEMEAVEAEFVAERKTAAAYDMFALKAVRKPLLLRGGTTSFDVEVWRIPMANVGQFLRDSVKAPLCLGDVLLDDGTEIKGFLGEAYAKVDAIDVSHFKGWRHYLKSLQQ